MCNGPRDLLDLRGNISTPRHDEGDPKKFMCEWKIKTDKTGNVIKVRTLNFLRYLFIFC